MCKSLNHFKHFPVLISAASGFVSISAFASLVDASVGISISAVGIKIYAVTAGINKYKSTRKKKNKNDKIELLEKAKPDTIEVLHDEFVSGNNVLREYNEMKEELKNSETSVQYTI